MALGKERTRPLHLLVRQPNRVARHQSPSRDLNRIATALTAMDLDPKHPQ